MKIIITETQYDKLLVESKTSDITKSIERSKKLTSRILNSAKEQTGLDFTFLLTWGATIGGFIEPVSDFINGEFPSISESNSFILMTGVILTYFTSNKVKLREVLDLIKEKNLVNEFDKVLIKTDLLEKVFKDFMESLGIAIHKLSNMLAYSFLIPLLPKLYELSKQSIDSKDINEIIKRIVSFGALTISGVTIKEMINAIIKRFKS